ncbi:ABC transporter permease [Sphaerimonospora sp. CA-214678]|uniref:ABC transporter permease n=1 Tax=Sphaerimonospora sp. CA-214678 TaxID=3240029 RepID=UPI003D9267B9
MTITTERPTAASAPRGSGTAGNSKRPAFWQSKAFINTARVLICVVFLALWEFASRQGWLEETLFGRPSGVWTAMLEYLPSERSIQSIKDTGGAVGVSFVIGSVSGTLAGLILGLSPTLNSVFGPFLAPINSVPRIALAPLFIAWFGLTMTAKVVLAVSIVFFILTENARSAVRSVDADLMTMARVVGLKRGSLLLKVVLPSAVPTMFAGLRLTFVYALLGVVASEMVAATGGLGQDIVLYSSSYQINTVFAILVELMAIAVIMNWLFNTAERRLLVWQVTD